MNINLYDIISVASLAVIILIIPQMVITHIISRITHIKFTLLKRIQFISLGIVVVIHWWMLAVLTLCIVLIVVMCGFVLNARRTIYLIASLLHIRWLAIWASDGIVYIDD